jgi:hypothetical protein
MLACSPVRPRPQQLVINRTNAYDGDDHDDAIDTNRPWWNVYHAVSTARPKAPSNSCAGRCIRRKFSEIIDASRLCPCRRQSAPIGLAFARQAHDFRAHFGHRSRGFCNRSTGRRSNPDECARHSISSALGNWHLAVGTNEFASTDRADDRSDVVANGGGRVSRSSAGRLIFSSSHPRARCRRFKPRRPRSCYETRFVRQRLPGEAK